MFVFLSGQFLGGGGSAAAVPVGWADAKVDLSFDRALLLGMLCNELGLPCAVRRDHDHKRQDPRGAFSGVRVRGSELLALGREPVPDSLGLFIKTGGLATLLSGLPAIPDLGSSTWANIAWSLVPVTQGNLIGGAGLVGAVYWFVYLRSYRQLRQSADTEAPAPLDLLRLNREAHIWKARDDAFERDRGLRPSELKTKAEMHTVPKERCGFGWRVMGLHSLNRSALERLIDQSAQAAVLRVVLSDHVEREKADRPRQDRVCGCVLLPALAGSRAKLSWSFSNVAQASLGTANHMRPRSGTVMRTTAPSARIRSSVGNGPSGTLGIRCRIRASRP